MPLAESVTYRWAVPMRVSKRQSFWRRLPRRICAVVALVAYLITAVGLPVPRVIAQNAGPNSPFQTRPCGCTTAGAGPCCCCTGGARHAPGECGADLAPSSSDEETGARSSCCAKHKPAPASSRAEAAPISSGGVRWVSALGALTCRGVSTLWIASGAVTVPPAPMAWEICPGPADWLPSHADHPLGLSLIPPDPPPRVTQS